MAKKIKRPEYPTIPPNRGEPPDHARTPSPYAFMATNGEVYLTPEGVAKLAEYRKALDLYEASVTGDAAKRVYEYREPKYYETRTGRCSACVHYIKGERNTETHRLSRRPRCARLQATVDECGNCRAFERKALNEDKED